MNLSEILKYIDIIELKGAENKQIDSVIFDSRKACVNTLFVAVKGTQSDGHNYIETAIESGCRVVVCEIMPTELNPDVTYVRVEDSEKVLAKIASIFYGNPSSKLKLVGVTGTNGKTTIATLLYDLFRALGYKVGLISTVVYKIEDKEIAATHTTPDVIRLNQLFAEMVDSGCEYCFMEVSSHSIVQKRVYGLDFDGAVFTNITHDHLDYHGTFAEYIKAKKMLFDSLKSSSFAIFNNDDKNGGVMVQNSIARKRSYSLHSISDYKCKVVEQHLNSTWLEIDGKELWVTLIGDFNAYNVLAIYATAKELGIGDELLLQKISALRSVAGRFEHFGGKGARTVIVDYAHTPDALENVLNTINSLKESGQRVVCIVGCGGNRDKSKRPQMARIAARNADVVILTSDNPRFENPMLILDDMKAGLVSADNYFVVEDRREAIRKGIVEGENSIILIAGKGHETYQEICGERTHFSDREEAEIILREL